jgi:general secretion pathway protein A
MYESFYGLKARPFDLTSDPRYLFLTGKHREALSNLEYGISARKGITLLVGEAGTGKTTLIRAVLEAQRAQDGIVYLNNPTLTRDEFLEFLAMSFGLPQGAGSKARLLSDLGRVLEERLAAGKVSALIIDEAQSLPGSLLEEVRLLTNMESATEKLLPLVLAGHPELGDQLNQAGLRQLKQRVALRCVLGALDLRETAAYIAKRIHVAGGEGPQVFTWEAVEAVHRHSQGIPRTVNVICDNALVSGFALEERPVGRETVLEVCRDFDLSGQALLEPTSRPRPPESPGEPQPVESAPAAPQGPERQPFFGIFGRRRFSFFS